MGCKGKVRLVRCWRKNVVDIRWVHGSYGPDATAPYRVAVLDRPRPSRARTGGAVYAIARAVGDLRTS